ncbi:hypothetical protein C4579_04315, partial [Candidatus Microgenomates bacterium]
MNAEQDDQKRRTAERRAERARKARKEAGAQGAPQQETRKKPSDGLHVNLDQVQQAAQEARLVRARELQSKLKDLKKDPSNHPIASRIRNLEQIKDPEVLSELLAQAQRHPGDEQRRPDVGRQLTENLTAAVNVGADPETTAQALADVATLYEDEEVLREQAKAVREMVNRVPDKDKRDEVVQQIAVDMREAVENQDMSSVTANVLMDSLQEYSDQAHKAYERGVVQNTSEAADKQTSPASIVEEIPSAETPEVDVVYEAEAKPQPEAEETKSTFEETVDELGEALREVGVDEEQISKVTDRYKEVVTEAAKPENRIQPETTEDLREATAELYTLPQKTTKEIPAEQQAEIEQKFTQVQVAAFGEIVHEAADEAQNLGDVLASDHAQATEARDAEIALNMKVKETRMAARKTSSEKIKRFEARPEDVPSAYLQAKVIEKVEPEKKPAAEAIIDSLFGGDSVDVQATIQHNKNALYVDTEGFERGAVNRLLETTVSVTDMPLEEKRAFVSESVPELSEAMGAATMPPTSEATVEEDDIESLSDFFNNPENTFYEHPANSAQLEHNKAAYLRLAALHVSPYDFAEKSNYLSAFYRSEMIFSKAARDEFTKKIDDLMGKNKARFEREFPLPSVDHKTTTAEYTKDERELHNSRTSILFKLHEISSIGKHLDTASLQDAMDSINRAITSSAIGNDAIEYLKEVHSELESQLRRVALIDIAQQMGTHEPNPADARDPRLVYNSADYFKKLDDQLLKANIVGDQAEMLHKQLELRQHRAMSSKATEKYNSFYLSDFLMEEMFKNGKLPVLEKLAFVERVGHFGDDPSSQQALRQLENYIGQLNDIRDKLKTGQEVPEIDRYIQYHKSKFADADGNIDPEKVQTFKDGWQQLATEQSRQINIRQAAFRARAVIEYVTEDKSMESAVLQLGDEGLQFLLNEYGGLVQTGVDIYMDEFNNYLWNEKGKEIRFTQSDLKIVRERAAARLKELQELPEYKARFKKALQIAGTETTDVDLNDEKCEDIIQLADIYTTVSLKKILAIEKCQASQQDPVKNPMETAGIWERLIASRNIHSRYFERWYGMLNPAAYAMWNWAATMAARASGRARWVNERVKHTKRETIYVDNKDLEKGLTPWGELVAEAFGTDEYGRIKTFILGDFLKYERGRKNISFMSGDVEDLLKTAEEPNQAGLEANIALLNKLDKTLLKRALTLRQGYKVLDKMFHMYEYLDGWRGDVVFRLLEKHYEKGEVEYMALGMRLHKGKDKKGVLNKIAVVRPQAMFQFLFQGRDQDVRQWFKKEIYSDRNATQRRFDTIFTGENALDGNDVKEHNGHVTMIRGDKLIKAVSRPFLTIQDLVHEAKLPHMDYSLSPNQQPSEKKAIIDRVCARFEMKPDQYLDLMKSISTHVSKPEVIEKLCSAEYSHISNATPWDDDAWIGDLGEELAVEFAEKGKDSTITRFTRDMLLSIQAV